MFGNVKTKEVPGHWGKEINSSVERMELVLVLLQDQRNAYMRNFQISNDQRSSAAQLDMREFSDDDMKEIMNSWRNNPQTWMRRPHKFEKLKDLRVGDRHKFIKSRFNAMKFHLLGNESLVDLIIRLNLCGTAQSADLQQFCKVWKEYTRTEAYEKSKKESKKKVEGHVRKAKKIWNLTQEMKRA